jgi:rhodanese-related sulfurtransferase
MKKITLKKLLQLNNPIIYDIRNKEEYNKYHIKNSINISFDIIYISYSTILNTFDTYYIVCEEGYRSKKLVKHLSKKGYNIIYVKHGLINRKKYLNMFDF